MATALLSVADVAVHQDSEGRFSLNDLHRAAGGEERHQPNRWLRSQQAAELVAQLDSELETTRIRAVFAVEGRGGGTYVVRELVYAYAMWISARFHLQVIRAYDALVTDAPPPGGLNIAQLLAVLRLAPQLLRRLVDAKNPAAQQLLHSHLAHAQRLLGDPVPPLDELLAARDDDGGQGTLPGMGGATGAAAPADGDAQVPA